MSEVISTGLVITVFSFGVLVGWVTLGLVSARARGYDD